MEAHTYTNGRTAIVTQNRRRVNAETVTTDGTTIVSAIGRTVIDSTEKITTRVTTWLDFLLKKYIGIFYQKQEEKERTSMNNIELLKKCVEPANMKLTVKNTCLELLKYGVYGLYYLLAMRGLNKVTNSIMHKFNHNHNCRNRWSNRLPQEIMEQILQRLCLNDHLRVRKVCRSWRSAFATVTDEKRCAPKPQLPQLLMFKTHYPSQNQFLKIKDHTLVNLYDGGRVSHSRHAELFGKHCFGSIEGWLIIEDTFLEPSPANKNVKLIYNIFFFNPFSRAKVALPTPIDSSERGSILYLRKAVASSTPGSPNCLVAAISRKGILALCRHPYNKWYVVRGQGYTEIRIHDGKLYALNFDAHSHLWVFNLLSNDPQNMSQTISIEPWPISVVIDSWRTRNVHVLGGSKVSCFHLATDSYSNELLLIAQIACDNSNSPKTKLFRVFKFHKTGLGQARWLQLETLGDRILFISHTSSICISASVMRERSSYFLGEEEDELLNGGNCIFFAFDYDCSKLNHSSSKARDVGVFSLADGRIKRKNLNILRSSTTRPPLWFTPNL